ncbi:MAG: hypothetical protein AB2L14_25325 [Candidatus Xenobiia bacterium LiM19]
MRILVVYTKDFEGVKEHTIKSVEPKEAERLYAVNAATPYNDSQSQKGRYMNRMMSTLTGR